MSKYVEGQPVELEEMRAVLDKVLGYPRRGVHVGGGIHVPMPDEWDGQGETPLGWTRTVGEPFLDVEGKLLLEVSDRTAQEVAEADTSKLSPGEQARLQAALARRVEMSPKQPAIEGD